MLLILSFKYYIIIFLFCCTSIINSSSSYRQKILNKIKKHLLRTYTSHYSRIENSIIEFWFIVQYCIFYGIYTRVNIPSQYTTFPHIIKYRQTEKFLYIKHTKHSSLLTVD